MVWRDVLADCETPVSAFRKIDRGGGDAFLLESVEGGEVWGRYSILASGVGARVVFRDGAGWLERGAENTKLAATEPLGALREALGPVENAEGLPPPPFRGGAVGFLGYDAVHHYAKVDVPARGREAVEAVFLLPESWLVFDRLRSRITVVAPSEARIAEVEAMLAAPLAPARAARAAFDPGAFEVDDAEFAARVRRAKEYVAAGDVIQVVLSRRRDGRYEGDPFDVYRALRLVNPSPYMFFLRAAGETLAGSSPEALVRVDGRKLTTRPIAGTRPRSPDPAEDAARERELLKDEKERAEHLMLVDLGRNDLGRVATIGSVKVPSFMRVERYSHVMHLVSDVTAELADGKDAFDAVRSVFPAGTLSGAPKVRAMQIVAELEGRARGPYGGLVGWFGADGHADTAIGIRMVRLGAGTFRVQAGAGIVYDSDPHAEAAETSAKAAGVMKALALAAEGL